MAFDGEDPCWTPVIPYGVERQWRLRKARFGDGYEQRITDGINALDMRFVLTYENRPQDVLIEMDNFLSSTQGGGFVFADPVTGQSFTVFCDEWDIQWNTQKRRDPVTWESKHYGTLTAKFTKANGVDIGPPL